MGLADLEQVVLKEKCRTNRMIWEKKIMVKKYYNRYTYPNLAENVFEAAPKENLETYQRKCNYGRKTLLINLSTLFNH